jgi:hypothetical protein
MSSSPTVRQNVPDFLFTALVITVVVLLGWAFAPGDMSADSRDLYTEAVTGSFTDWHTPFVSWVWALLGAKPWVLVLTLAVTMGGFAFLAYQLYRRADFSHRTACFFTILTCCTPPVLGDLGFQCRDTWVAVLFVAVLYLSICYHARPSNLTIILRGIVCAIAMLIRQEFLLVIATFLFLELLYLTDLPLARRLRYLAASGAIIGVAFWGINKTVFHFAHVVRTHPEQAFYLHDLDGLSVATNQILIPQPFLAGNDLQTLRKHYSVDANSCFWGHPASEMLHFSSDPQDVAGLRQRWIHEILNHPVYFTENHTASFVKYLIACQFYQGSLAPNGFGVHRYNEQSYGLLYRYMSFFRYSFPTHLISLLGSPMLIILMFRYGPGTITRQLFQIALACGFIYQLFLGTVVGVAPDPRYGYLGVVVFWISLYIVAKNVWRAKYETLPSR